MFMFQFSSIGSSQKYFPQLWNINYVHAVLGFMALTILRILTFVCQLEVERFGIRRFTAVCTEYTVKDILYLILFRLSTSKSKSLFGGWADLQCFSRYFTFLFVPSYFEFQKKPRRECEHLLILLSGFSSKTCLTIYHLASFLPDHISDFFFYEFYSCVSSDG